MSRVHVNREVKLDPMDMAIIGQLQGDAMMTNAAVARALLSSEETIRRRMHTLQDKCVISRKLELDWRALGYGVEVIIRIATTDDVGTIMAYIKEQADLDGAPFKKALIEEGRVVTGQFDLVLTVRTRDLTHWMEFRRKLLACPGVSAFQDEVVLETVS